jgi:formyl-CoA transferase
MVLSSKAIVAMANREGMLLDLKDYDWAHLDVSRVPQEELGRMEGLATEFFLTKTKAELFEEAIKESILLCPATTVKDILESPQLKVRDFWVEVEHPELGDTIAYPGAPVKASEAPWRVWRRAPLIGEHNEEIYHGELGLPKEELSLLKARGVI